MSSINESHPALQPVSDWTLERIALGELVGEELVQVHQRLVAEPGGVERLRALERSNAQILTEYPPERMVPRIARAIARQEEQQGQGAFRRGWWAGLSVGLAAAAAALAFALVLPPAPDAGPQPGPEVTRLKGLEPHVVVHRRGANDRSERLAAGTAVEPGDVLQLSYVASGEGYGAIVSIDGAGVVTLHHPEMATAPAVLDGDGRINLPYSYELDDAPGFERFVFVTSDQPLDLEAVLLGAKRLAGTPAARDAELPVDSHLHQHSLLLEKAGTP
ncbi:MAG: ActD-like protein [Deltaproteobacteria bacterium]|nr:ActD-like protein [Deltaproteobacteria bacterium]